MTTLAALNDTLLSQGKVLEEVSDNTAKTSGAIDRFVSYMEGKKGDDLEAQRELKKSLMQKVTGGAAAAGGAVKRGASSFSENFKFPGGLLTGAGLTALGASLMGGLGRRAIPAAIGAVFADEIGDWVTSATGKKELGEAAERATLGASFGLLLGKRFALLGGIIGGLATEENVKLVTEIGQNLKEAAAKLNIPIPSLENLQEGVTKGLEGIKAITEGDFQGFVDNLLPALGVIGATGLLIAPGPFMRGLKNIARFAGTRKGGRLLAIAAAVAAGTYVYDNFFDGIVGDDGSGEITTEDIVGGAAIAGGAALAAKGATKMVRRGPTAAEVAEQTKANSKMPPKVVGTVKGKNVVRSKAGNLAIQGADGQATTNIVKESDLDKAKWWKRFPRLSKFAAFPGSSILFAALDAVGAAQIMADPQSTDKQKAEEIGGLIGGALGSAGFIKLGTILGGAAGTAGFPGVGTLLGGFTGGALLGTAGYFFGNSMGRDLMGWFMGTSDGNEYAGKRGDRSRRRKSQGISGTMMDESYSPPPSQISKPPIDSGVPSGAAQMYKDPIMQLGTAPTITGQIGDNVVSNNAFNNLPQSAVDPFDNNSMLWGAAVP